MNIFESMGTAAIALAILAMLGLLFFMSERRKFRIAQSSNPSPSPLPQAEWPQVPAVILASSPTSSQIDGQTRIDFLVRVEPPGQLAYEAKTSRFLDALEAARYYKADVRVLVRVCPDDPSLIGYITLVDPPIPRPPVQP